MKISLNADKIRMWRKERGWSQEQVAEMAGVSPRTIQRIESNGTASRESTVALANVYSVDPSVLMIDLDDQVEKAVEKQDAKNLIQFKMSFGIHAISFVMVSAMLVLINLADNPQELWFIWPVAGWGIGVIAHGATVYMVDYVAKKKQEIQALDSM